MSSKGKLNSGKGTTQPAKHSVGAARQGKLKVSAWEKMVTDPAAAGMSGKLPATPKINPFTCARRLFQRTFQIRAADFANGKFSMRFYPQIFDAFEIHGSGAFELAQGNWTLINVHSRGKNEPMQMPQQIQWFETQPDGSGVKAGECAVKLAPDGSPYVPLQSGDALNSLTFSTNSFAPIAVRFLNSSGEWGTLSTSFSSGTNNVTPFGLNHIGFGFVATSDSSYNGATIHVEANNVVGSTLTVNEGTYDLFQTQAVELGQIEGYVVPAMSILATYSGNKFNSGGVIASARVRPGYKAGPDVYESLVQLTDHVYRGPMETGTYVWYLPTTLHELESRGVYDAVRDDLTSLIVAGQFTDPEGSLQITLSEVVEFYSPKQIFEKEVSPPLTDEFVIAYHALDSLPAGLCNPEHKELLRKLIENGLKAARKGGKFLIAHPELLSALASAL